MAAEFGRDAVLARLLRAGADPDARSRELEDGETPLLIATNNSQVGAVRLLLAHGAAPNPDASLPLPASARSLAASVMK